MSRASETAAALLAALLVCTWIEDGPSGSKPDEEKIMANGTTVETMIVDLERTALDQFEGGDIDGPLALCDTQITYFDPFVERRH